MKIEKGVMAVKDGKAWGIVYEDGHCTEYGWIDIEDAPIHDPKYCKKTTDIVNERSHYIKELLTASLVHVERKTEVIINHTLQGE